MVDLPERGEARFPQALVPAAREAIRGSILKALAPDQPPPVGIASAARGGDILFHEECRALGLRTIVILPFSPEIFAVTSVKGVPRTDWTKRFRRLWKETAQEDREVMGLPDSSEAYAACNARIIERARQRGPFHLIALWDGRGGDGPGGTADLIRQASEQADRPVIIAPGGL